MISRRSFVGVLSGLVAAPMVAKAESLMKIKGTVIPKQFAFDPALESFLKFSFTPHFDRIDPSVWEPSPEFYTYEEQQRFMASWRQTMEGTARLQLEDYHKTEPIYITHPDTRIYDGNWVRSPHGTWYMTAGRDPALRAHLKAAFAQHTK